MILKIKYLQISIILIAVIGCIWFLLPLVLFGILNIGNMTGIFVFVCLFAYGFAMTKINSFIVKFSKKRWGKIVVRIAGFVMATGVLTVLLFSTLMIQAANKKQNGDEVVIVLGCRVYGERASLMLEERLDAAYEYLSQNKEAVCILSGGQGAGEDVSEAECMYRYLTENGIDAKRLYKEEQSTSTRENLAFSKVVIEDNQLNTNIAIVTNEFHEYRAKKVADSLSLKSSAISAKTAWWLFPTYYVRELYGIMYEIFSFH